MNCPRYHSSGARPPKPTSKRQFAGTSMYCIIIPVLLRRHKHGVFKFANASIHLNHSFFIWCCIGNVMLEMFLSSVAVLAEISARTPRKLFIFNKIKNSLQAQSIQKTKTLIWRKTELFVSEFIRHPLKMVMLLQDSGLHHDWLSSQGRWCSP